MKKLIIATGLLFAVGMSAQTQQERMPKYEKPTLEQQMKAFDQLSLTTKQKKEVEALLKEREAKFEKQKPQMPPKGEQGQKGERPTKGERPAPSTNGERPMPPAQMGTHKSKFEREQSEFKNKLQKILSSEQYSKYEASMVNQKPQQRKSTK